MRKKICQLCMLVISLTLVLGLVINVSSQNQVDAIDEADANTDFFVLDKNGIPVYVDTGTTNENEDEEYKIVVDDGTDNEVLGTYDNFDEANEFFENKKNDIEVSSMIRSRTVREISNNNEIQILNEEGDLLRSDSNACIMQFDNMGKTVNYIEYNTGRTGYFAPSYSADAAYLGTEGDYYVGMLAGVKFKVLKSKIDLVIKDYNASNAKTSYYTVSNGYLIHYYTYYLGGNIAFSSTRVGYPTAELKSGVKYYSYDGHYFYDDFKKMISDYKNNTHTNSKNKTAYYNYYQFLSLRSKTNISANQLNDRINYVVSKKGLSPSSSKMYNKAKSFIDTQNTYGINALIMFGVASNESAYGTSTIAKNKNNLFGLNAVDSSPGTSADTFASPEACINDFAYGWMSKGYLSPIDSRYRGPHLGDKNSGINVKYASDVYWGEKAASQGYFIDTNKSDYGNDTIGIAKNVKISIYNQPSTSLKELYNSEAVGSGKQAYMYDYPLLILGKVTGSDGKLYYKVQTDCPLTEDRSRKNIKDEYDFSRDYGYVLASEVNIVSNDITSNVEVKLGDVNLDGNITPSDYVLIKNHIMGKKITGDGLKAADVNQDGNITPADYVLVKNMIMS